MTLAIEHGKVRESEDRSWTFALIDAVVAPLVSESERDDAFATLAHLEDPRSIGPLMAIVEDLSLPDTVRDAASSVLAGFYDCRTAERCRAWWASEDQVLMAHGLRLMERSEADIVLAVASDAAHPLQSIALLTMLWGFDEPEYQTAKIRALGHPDANVRFAAADVLLWDEPVAAEGALLDASMDADSRVAVAAIDALEYYPSRRVLRALADLAASAGDDERSARALASIEFNRGRFEYAATHGSEPQLAELREWMEPVADLVRWSEAPSEPDTPSVHKTVPRLAVSERDLLALIADPDGQWAPKKQTLHRVDWDRFTKAERERLSTALASHPDPFVRGLAAVPLAAWSRSDLLLGLITDPSFGVRKSATYGLSHVPKDEALAAPVWEHMLETASTAAHEAVQTYATHAPPTEARTRLVELAHNDRRESVRTAVITALVELNARTEFETLIPLLRDPPGVTWAVHILIIDGLRTLGLTPPELDHLTTVDNLDLIESVIALRHSASWPHLLTQPPTRA